MYCSAITHLVTLSAPKITNTVSGNILPNVGQSHELNSQPHGYKVRQGALPLGHCLQAPTANITIFSPSAPMHLLILSSLQYSFFSFLSSCESPHNFYFLMMTQLLNSSPDFSLVSPTWMAKKHACLKLYSSLGIYQIFPFFMFWILWLGIICPKLREHPTWPFFYTLLHSFFNTQYKM